MKQLNHVFNIYNNKAAEYTKSELPLLSSGHGTRYNMSNFVVPRVDALGINSFKYTGTKFWKNLPLFVKSLQYKFDFGKAVVFTSCEAF